MLFVFVYVCVCLFIVCVCLYLWCCLDQLIVYVDIQTQSAVYNTFTLCLQMKRR